ncbi:MAG: hypothetical protein PHS49_05070 [Candidatus Gracilibacteria bacterium]|nr:hypothetical protein [Candidatus Gracilibacteria bacterium]
MNYLFTGNSEFLIKQEVKKWKTQFESKYGNFNLIHIKDFESVENNFLTLNITSSGFGLEKKLIVIDLEEKKNNKNTEIEQNDKSDKGSDKLDLLLNLLTKSPENNIVLLNIANPDKRTKFYKGLLKLCDVKEFTAPDNNNIFSYIRNKYPTQITNDAINTIIKYKSNNLSKIINEIEKLLIYYDHIDKKEVVENIMPELEESIFQVIDDILNKHILEAIKKIDIILNDTVIYAFYNNLLANLRTSVYIMKLKESGKKSSEISQILDLGNKSFLVDKRYNINYKQLKKLYINLINIDKQMKSGKLFGTEDSDFYYAFERQLLAINN